MADISDLGQSVRKWLATEGYPLEYYSAAVFRSAGLSVNQGYFSRRSADENPREVDLIADVNASLDRRFLRLSTVVECKWSGDRPVVIFTDEHARMATSACVTQTIASDVGSALAWLVRGHEEVQKLSMFSSPENPGYGGRQAFGKNDRFFGALAAVTSACATLSKRADRQFEDCDFVQHYGLLTFPVIVVDGPIFETRYCPDKHDLSIVPVTHSRIHWRGAPEFSLIATVDAVTRQHLQEFANTRFHDCAKLLPILLEQLAELVDSYENKRREIIFGNRGPSGLSGLPRLLAKLAQES